MKALTLLVALLLIASPVLAEAPVLKVGDKLADKGDVGLLLQVGDDVYAASFLWTPARSRVSVGLGAVRIDHAGMMIPGQPTYCRHPHDWQRTDPVWIADRRDYSALLSVSIRLTP